GPPVMTLLLQQTGEIEERWISVAVVEPHYGENFVLPAKFTPLTKRTIGELAKLMGKIFFQDRNHTRVPCRFLILGEGFQHDHPRPPVVVAFGTDHAIGGLMSECPVDKLLCLGLESSVLQQVSKRDQAVEKIRSPFPRFALATEPSAVGAG